MTRNSRPPRLGTVNGFVESQAWLDGEQFTYNGTTLGLVREALKRGATDGSLVATRIMLGGERVYEIESAPHDDRANGFWAVERRDLDPMPLIEGSSPRP